MSPRFSSTIFYPDANSRLLRAHLCTTVDSSIGGLYGVPISIDSVGLVPVFKFQEPRGSGVDEALVVWSLGGE